MTPSDTDETMVRRRSIPRRRFVSLASVAAVGTLAGCPGTDDAGRDDGADDEPGDRNDAGNETTDPDEGGVPDVEGTNVFVEVVDGEGVPVPGVTVTVTGGTYDGEEFETDSGGGVILQNVDPGEYTITATAEGSEDERTVSLEEGEDAHLTLSVRPPGWGRTETGEPMARRVGPYPPFSAPRFEPGSIRLQWRAQE